MTPGQEMVSVGLGATQIRVFILVLPQNHLCDLRQVPSPLWAFSFITCRNEDDCNYLKVVLYKIVVKI